MIRLYIKVPLLLLIIIIIITIIIIIIINFLYSCYYLISFYLFFFFFFENITQYCVEIRHYFPPFCFSQQTECIFCQFSFFNFTMSVPVLFLFLFIFVYHFISIYSFFFFFWLFFTTLFPYCSPSRFRISRRRPLLRNVCFSIYLSISVGMLVCIFHYNWTTFTHERTHFFYPKFSAVDNSAVSQNIPQQEGGR